MVSLDRVFDVATDGFNGNIEAYLANAHEEYAVNFLNRLVDDSELISRFEELSKKNNLEILVIKSLNVEEEYRGNGYGSSILDGILCESDCDIALLEVDMGETQVEGFDLLEFYLRHGFEILSGNILIYPAGAVPVISPSCGV